jgi:hypothetical protein
MELAAHDAYGAAALTALLVGGVKLSHAAEPGVRLAASGCVAAA